MLPFVEVLLQTWREMLRLNVRQAATSIHAEQIIAVTKVVNVPVKNECLISKLLICRLFMMNYSQFLMFACKNKACKCQLLSPFLPTFYLKGFTKFVLYLLRVMLRKCCQKLKGLQKKNNLTGFF